MTTPILGRIRSNPEEVDHQMRRLLGERFDTTLAGVRAVLIGHSHYDHAMDVPTLMKGFLPRARIVGGTTTKHILMGDTWIREHEVIDEIPFDSAGTPWRVGQWLTVGERIRVMALRSAHAPNFAGITIASGHADRDYDHLPRTAWGWKLGDPYAFLVDVLDARGRPAFRVFYNDAASEPVNALLPPFPEPDQRSVDVAIISAGNFENAESYPTIVAGALHPQFMIVGHWEDFFHSMDDEPTPIRFTDTETLERRLDLTMGGRWFTPEPGGQIRIRYPGNLAAAAP